MTIHLKGMTWDHPRGYEPLIACSKAYAAEHDVQITWDKRSLKAFGDQPIDDIAREYDVLVIDHPHAGLAAATGCLMPLDEWLPEATLATLASESAGLSHQSYQFEGHQWALAMDAAMQAAVYRADLLTEPVPDSWEAVLQLGANLREADRYIAMPLVPTDAICSFITLCASLGEPLDGGAELVSRSIGLAALDMLRRLADVAHPDSLNWNPIYLLDYMSSNSDVAYCPLTFNYTNYSRAGQVPHLLTFTTMPGIRGAILGGTGYAVSANCKHPQVAVDFGAWVCSADVQRGLYVHSQGQPGNVKAWQDDDANALTHNFFRNTLPTLEGSYIRPRHHGFVTFQEQAGEVIHAFLRDGTHTDACFDALNALYQEHRS